MFKFDPKKLNTKKKLGYSKHGNIYPYQNSPDDNTWAVKCLHPKDFQEIQHVLHEIVLTSNLNHPAILPLRNYYIKEDETEGWRVFLKMPRMERSLEDLINEYSKSGKGLIPKEVIIKCFYSLASGLEYLESKRIIHKAIKPYNVLLDQQGNVKLTGIGVNSLEIENMAGYRESDLYIAPELCNQSKQDLNKKELYKASVWSLGILIMELCLLKPRNAANLSEKEKEDIVKADMKEICKNYGEDLASVLENDLLCINQGERKTFTDICHTLEERFLSSAVFNTEPNSARSTNEEEKFSKEGSEIGSHCSSNLRRRRGVLVINEAKKNVKPEPAKVVEPKPLEGGKAVIEDMRKKWKGIFEFNLDDTLKIVANQPNTSELSQVSNEKLVQMITDLNKSLTEFKTTTVKKLALDLISCEKITDEGLIQLTPSFDRDLKNLEELSLNFPKSPMITYNGVIQLSLHIGRHLQNLKKLTLDFRDCQSITSTAKDTVKSLLNNVPQLTIV